MKKCIKCNELKPLSEFNFRNKDKGYRHSKCKLCNQEYNRYRWNNNINGARDKTRKNATAYRYKYEYNMPKDVMDKMLKDNTGACEMCKKEGILFVDHCHKTKKYRGLLCRSCNLVLGYAKDNINTLLAGAEYLKVQFS